MTHPGPFRIFVTILRPSPAFVALYVAIVVWAGYLAWTSPGDMRAVYVVLLLCQSFSAASGFLFRARRGHFDQALIAPASRGRAALCHGAVSIALGVVSWLLVVIVEAASSRGAMPLGLAAPSLAALLYLSAAAWATSLPFARYSSGVVWLIAVIGLAGTGKLLALRQVYVAAVESTAGAWTAAGAALVFPPLMITEPAPPLAVSTFVVLAAAVVVSGIGVLAIEALDFPLVDPS